MIDFESAVRTIENGAGFTESDTPVGEAWAVVCAEIERLRDAYAKQVHDVEQTLGQALGYPWYKDDQKNFPGATEADGVCVGEHVPETLAAEAAAQIEMLRAIVARVAQARRMKYIGITGGGNPLIYYDTEAVEAALVYAEEEPEAASHPPKAGPPHKYPPTFRKAAEAAKEYD